MQKAGIRAISMGIASSFGAIRLTCGYTNANANASISVVIYKLVVFS